MRISPRGDVATLINVFTVAPEDQQRLLDLLVEATESVMRGLPGFVSANLHKSFDGTRVANYTQWRSQEVFEAMLENLEAAVNMEKAEDRREVRTTPIGGTFSRRGLEVWTVSLGEHVPATKIDPRREFRGPYPSERYAGIWSSSTSAFTTGEAEG